LSAGGTVRMTPSRWAYLLHCIGATAILSDLLFLREESVLLRTWHVLPVLVWAALAFNVRGISAALAITSAFHRASRLWYGPAVRQRPPLREPHRDRNEVCRRGETCLASTRDRQAGRRPAGSAQGRHAWKLGTSFGIWGK
jgi:hypothetical protein